MDDFNKKNRRFIRIITIAGIGVFLAIVGFLIFSFISPEKADNISFNMEKNAFVYVTIGMLLFTIFIVIYGVILNKEYRQKLMATKPKNICAYLDTFYYTVSEYSGGELESAIKMYHIVKDLSVSRIYAIPAITFSNIDFVKTKKNFDLTISGSDKKITEGTKLYFWIDEEMNNLYKREGNNITIGKQKLIYTREPDNCIYSSLQTPKLYNLNEKYDISLLDKATFAYGYAEFVDE